MILSTDINETLRDAEFKDERPLKTVEKIKEILRANGIETEEKWGESGVPYCHSLRVTVCGTTFGTNGKGLSREFALASAYGELMERLQFGQLGSIDAQKDGADLTVEKKGVFLQAKDLLERNRKWYEYYSEQVEALTGDRISPEDIMGLVTNADGTVAVTRYFCVNTGETEYIPTRLRKKLYVTNGCAAGNTAEEAIVQALSEIVERHYHKRILTQNLATPEIPDCELKQYSVAYHIISYLRDKGFRVYVKDCSLGTKFPMVCVCVIDTATGKYHEHFGAYPILEIAIERALTESFQGRNIETFTMNDEFLYDKAVGFPLHKLEHSFVKGVSEQKPEFFIGRADSEWNKNCGFSGKSNKELLKECIIFFAEQGYDVLIRDCSCFGFPTYQILIPGYSEIYTHRLSAKHDPFRNGNAVMRVVRNPVLAGLDDILALIDHVERGKNAARDSIVLQFTHMAHLSADLTPAVQSKLLAATMACVFYTLGHYSVVLGYLQQMIPFCEQTEQEYLLGLKRYLSMKQNRYDDGQIRALLDMFHKPETVRELYACFAENRNPLERFTLHCTEQCDENCPIKQSCCVPKTNQLAGMISKKIDEMDFEVSVAQLKKML